MRASSAAPWSTSAVTRGSRTGKAGKKADGDGDGGPDGTTPGCRLGSLPAPGHGPSFGRFGAPVHLPAAPGCGPKEAADAAAKRAEDAARRGDFAGAEKMQDAGRALSVKSVKENSRTRKQDATVDGGPMEFKSLNPSGGDAKSQLRGAFQSASGQSADGVTPPAVVDTRAKSMTRADAEQTMREYLDTFAPRPDGRRVLRTEDDAVEVALARHAFVGMDDREAGDTTWPLFAEHPFWFEIWDPPKNRERGLRVGRRIFDAFADDGRWSAFLTDDLQVLLATYSPERGLREF
ncbi:MAG: hypothetical protein GEV11_16855 [Streptosporangiales bacterium]|nr:hypothetical protein [Streptosporangiales bacterium]